MAKAATTWQDPAVQESLLPMLEGAEKGAYVVAPIDQLLHEWSAAMHETRDHRTGALRPHAAMPRFVLALDELGYIHRVRA